MCRPAATPHWPLFGPRAACFPTAQTSHAPVLVPAASLERRAERLTNSQPPTQKRRVISSSSRCHLVVIWGGFVHIVLLGKRMLPPSRCVVLCSGIEGNLVAHPAPALPTHNRTHVLSGHHTCPIPLHLDKVRRPQPSGRAGGSGTRGSRVWLCVPSAARPSAAACREEQ